MPENAASPSAPPSRADVAIVGGGLVGLTLAAALGKAGLTVTVIDRDRPSTHVAPEYDGRSSAIALGSARVFRGVGLWPLLQDHAQPIWDIRVADGHVLRGVSPLFLHYDHADIGDDPFGYIIENRYTRAALHSHIPTLETVTWLAPDAATRVDRDAHAATVHLESGKTVRASLVIAADGKKSAIRAGAGIRTTGWDYDQTSIVCTVRHARSHNGTAVELFLPGGPFAILPMTDDRSNIVWSDQRDRAAAIMALDDDAFLEELSARFGDWLGKIELVGPRFAFPLSLSHAETYVAQRLALVGDAGHAIHPIAGQGLNMGLRDVAALADVLVDARRLGMDLGAPDVLQRYERWRRFDNVLLAAVTDGLTRLFSNDVPPVRLARDIGLAAVNRLPPAKKFLMRHAMGVVGELPRLIRGEAL
ncbi:MAG: 2-octaprenyl-6-methoxyphenyl hydroxylase [Alphaproteobacteria bacterium]